MVGWPDARFVAQTLTITLVEARREGLRHEPSDVHLGQLPLVSQATSISYVIIRLDDP